MNKTANDSQKLYYSIGEVAEMFDISHSLIRFWEKEFPFLSLKKNSKGNRIFTPKDLENLKILYHLIKVKGYTLEGAKKVFREEKKAVKSNQEIVASLEKIKASLEQMRASLD